MRLPDRHTISGNIRPQSSQLGEPRWTDPGIKSEISARELISTSKKKKKKKERKKEKKKKKKRRRRRKSTGVNEWSNILPNPRKREKATAT